MDFLLLPFPLLLLFQFILFRFFFAIFSRTQQLRFVERLLSAERTFFSSGDSRLAGEYVLGCVLDAVQLVQPNALAHFPKLMRFFDAIFVLPAYDGVKDLRCPAHFLRDP